jgi:hypothetical protein
VGHQIVDKHEQIRYNRSMTYDFKEDPYQITDILLKHLAYSKGYNDALRDVIESVDGPQRDRIISMLEGMFQDA